MDRPAPAVSGRSRAMSWLCFPNVCNDTAVARASKIKPTSISWEEHFCEGLAHTTQDIQLECFSVYQAFTQNCKEYIMTEDFFIPVLDK